MTGGPALVLCNGYSANDLPLGMQLAGRPFAEEAVLKVAHAYEQATPWRQRKPALVAGCAPAPVTIDIGFPATPEIDARTRGVVHALAERAGFTLSESQFAELCHAAPYAFAMLQRMRRHRARFEEPANVFRFSG